MSETRAERSAKRRAETLITFNNKFITLLEDEDKKHPTLPPSEKMHNAVMVMEAYIFNLIHAKPQETTFYTSIALEFQRDLIGKLKENRKDTHNPNTKESQNG